MAQNKNPVFFDTFMNMQFISSIVADIRLNISINRKQIHKDKADLITYSIPKSKNCFCLYQTL